MDTSADPGPGGRSWALPPSTAWVPGADQHPGLRPGIGDGPGGENGTGVGPAPDPEHDPGLDPRPDATGPGIDESAVDNADDLFDLDDDARQRPGRVTFVLAAAVIAGLGFTGGAYAQRHLGGTTTGAPSGLRSQVTRGMSAEGFPGGGAMPSGAPGHSSGSSSGSSAGGSSGTSAVATSTTPVVVGTVTAIDTGTLTVKNLGGTSVVVKVATGTPITVNGLGSALKVGSLVSVTGTKAVDGSVTARSVTARG
jgi:hypothetical protein